METCIYKNIHDGRGTLTKILINLLFYNSIKWIHRFFECLEKTYEIPDITFDLYVVYGDDTDGTSTILPKLLDDIQSKYDTKIIKRHVTLPKRLDGIQKLVILRNSFITAELSDYDYILNVDTDIMYEPFTLVRLIKNMQNSTLENPGVIAQMVFIERYYAYVNSYFYDSLAFRVNGKMFYHTKPYLPIKLFGRDRQKQIIPVDSVGSFYLAKADIFTKYDIRYSTYLRNLTDPNIPHPQRKYESEQVVFCQQVTEKTDYKIYVDMNAKVFHINLQSYGMVWH